eukprot:7382841-Prymnesium_polylepis.2
MPFRVCSSARQRPLHTDAFMSNAVDRRSAARCRNTILCAKTILFYRSEPPRLAASHVLRPQPSYRVQRSRVPCSRLLLCAHAGSRSPLGAALRQCMCVRHGSRAACVVQHACGACRLPPPSLLPPRRAACVRPSAVCPLCLSMHCTRDARSEARYAVITVITNRLVATSWAPIHNSSHELVLQ